MSYEVLRKIGPDVKLRLERKEKWVHIDNVRRYTGPASSIVHKAYAEHVIAIDPKREEQDTTASEEVEQGEEFERYSEEEGQFVGASQPLESISSTSKATS